MKIVIRLSILIAILSPLAAGAGVFWQGEGEPVPFTTMRGESVSLYGRGLYRFDSVSYAAQAIAQDVVTLILGIPLLAAGIVLARRGSLRGQLLMTGTLGYFLYTYTSYAFLAAYNPLGLIPLAVRWNSSAVSSRQATRPSARPVTGRIGC